MNKYKCIKSTGNYEINNHYYFEYSETRNCYRAISKNYNINYIVYNYFRVEIFDEYFISMDDFRFNKLKELYE